MMAVGPNSPRRPSESAEGGAAPCGGGRLNLLLTSGDWRDETWADLMPRLLAPLGVLAHRAKSGVEATEILKRTRIDIAVVDLALPMEGGLSEPQGRVEGGARLLEVLSRFPSPPPTLVVKRRKTLREDTREISLAMRAGAFAVIERPVHMELVLQALGRVLQRHHKNCWPGQGPV